MLAVSEAAQPSDVVLYRETVWYSGGDWSDDQELNHLVLRPMNHLMVQCDVFVCDNCDIIFILESFVLELGHLSVTTLKLSLEKNMVLFIIKDIPKYSWHYLNC